MRKYLLLFTLLLTACAHNPSTGILAPNCAKTPIQVNDLAALGFKPTAGKIVVLRVFATWCPFCKSDLTRMGELFRKGTWQPQDVEILLLAYHNHNEDQNSFAQFSQGAFPTYGLPKEVVQMIYIDQPYSELVKRKTATGQELLNGWSGVPYALVFGKDGRLAFRGHFTMSDGYQENHYKFITGLTREKCTINP